MSASTDSTPGFPASLRSAAARLLIRLRIKPLHLTIAGFILSCFSGWLFFGGLFRWACVVLVFSGLCDLFDGAVARLSGGATALGGFLDSTVDRLSEAAVLCGILLYYNRLQTDTYLTVFAAYLALVGSFLVSYTRARAECIISRCSVGLFQRPQRIVALCVGGLTGVMPLTLWLIAAASGLTAVERILYVRRSVRNDSAENSAGGAGPSGP